MVGDVACSFAGNSSAGSLSTADLQTDMRTHAFYMCSKSLIFGLVVFLKTSHNTNSHRNMLHVNCAELTAE